MYAKSLIPGDPPTASLICTTGSEIVFGQLLDHGWAAYGQLPTEPATSRLLIVPDSLQLEVDGQILLADHDPLPPDGWWPAVDGQHGRVVVVVVRSGDVDLHDPHAGSILQSLMDVPGSGVWAMIPVVHSTI